MEIATANALPFEPGALVTPINGHLAFNDDSCAIQLMRLGARQGTAFLGMSAKIFARQIGGDHPPEPMPDWNRPAYPEKSLERE